MPNADLFIFCCRVADIDAALLADYQILLDAGELKRSAGFRSTPAQTQFIISRALLRTALAKQLNCAPHELRFVRDADDKPQLAAPFGGWHFNLSHGPNWVVLALSRAGPVGIDVESHGRGNDLPAIAKRFFSSAENDSLQGLEEGQWLQQFFAIWTLKEAHGKALGSGLSKILSCSSIGVDFSRNAIDWNLSGIARSRQAIFSALYPIDANASLAVVQHFDGSAPSLTCLRSVPLRQDQPFPLAPMASGVWSPDD
jgi:phosphopantetheine--protein transferase-like protein